MTNLDDPWKAVIGDPKHALFGARVKIDRARALRRDLHESMKAYLSTDWYAIEPQIDPTENLALAVIRIKRPVDPTWSVMVGDIVHNLRSALDYLIHELVKVETGSHPPPAPKGKTQFPICLSPEHFDKASTAMLEGVGDEARALIRSHQPFATGHGAESPLAILATLSNLDKHRSIQLTAASLKDPQASAIAPEVRIYAFGPCFVYDDTLLCGAKVAPGPEPLVERADKAKLSCQAKIHIALEQPLSLPQHTVQEVVDAMGRNVATIAREICTKFFARAQSSAA
jgi:hypothetical protein